MCHYTQRNHTHVELFTKALGLELSQDKNLLAPFSGVRYESVKSREESAHLKLIGFVYNEQRYQIEIYKTVSCFNIRVKGGQIENAPETLTGLLKSEGFKLSRMELPRLGIYRYYKDNNQKSIEDVKLKIQKLCKSLKELDDEKRMPA